MPGQARQGEGVARHGVARHGWARPGMAGRGKEKALNHNQHGGIMDENQPQPMTSEVFPPGHPPYNLDVASLQRGQDITEMECEEYIGMKSTDKRWQFAMMMFVSWIIYESETSNDPLSVCQRKGGVHINTDAEAAVYHDRAAAKHEDGIRRNHERLCRNVRVNHLTEIQKTDHEQNVKVWSLKLAAMNNVRLTAPKPSVRIEGG
jgi:hypothetical protein